MTFTRSEENKRKISESVKANWVIRKQKYGNSEGCSSPEDRRQKISKANKGKRVVPLGTPPWNKGAHGLMPTPWNKGLSKETNITLKLSIEKQLRTKSERGVKPAWNRGIKNQYTMPPKSKETRLKISESHLKFHRENPGKGGWSGKHIPEEVKQKMKKAGAIRLARQPHKDTRPEREMAIILESLKINYQKQIPVDSSVPDFFIQPNICVFVDGEYWHNRPEVKSRDVYINRKLVELGYKVMRFWDYEIYNNPINVKHVFESTLGYITQELPGV
jgi:very-short-patch-repair endonuclease